MGYILGLYLDNGKQHGDYYLGFRVFKLCELLSRFLKGNY